MTPKELEKEKMRVQGMCLELKAKRLVSNKRDVFLPDNNYTPAKLEAKVSPVFPPGRGVPADGAPERHAGLAVGPDLRGAAGVEAAAADRLHRRPAQRLRGPAAELVRTGVR